MVTTHKFTQSNPVWHPLVSQLYISLLIYIHIIRCMVESDTSNIELLQFYDLLYRHLGLESLVVPGPLVPLFAAITLSSSPHEWLGNICPTIPMTTGASAHNGFLLQSRLYMCLPSIPFIIDQLYELATLGALTDGQYATWQNRISNIFTSAANNTTEAIYNVLTPNARFHTFVPRTMAEKFATYMPSLNLPSRLTHTATASQTEMSYLQFFGFEAYDTTGTASNWLTTVGPIMSTYSSFFQGSVSLMSISPIGLGASLPVATFRASTNVVPDRLLFTAAVNADATNNIAAVASYVKKNLISSTATDISHAAPNLSELAEQYAALSIVNCDYTVSGAASSTLNGPTNATLRTGAYWSLPTIRAAIDIDALPGIANNVASYYHSSVPVRK